MKSKIGPGSLCLPAVGLAVLTVAMMTGRSLKDSMRVEAQDNPATPAFYTEKVQPILTANCYRCHGNGAHRGGFNMDTRDGMLQGGHDGHGVVPGHPEQSWMVRLVRHEGPADDPMNMPPPPKPKLSDTDIAVVEAWVRAGAAMPPTGPASGNATTGR